MSDDAVAEAKEAFKAAQDAENDNRTNFIADIKFGRLGEQWPEAIETQRRHERRPCLTINKMPAFMRQVVNDARMNKPQIKVRPIDGGADKDTADIMSGLIRNIEQASDADVAYDTAAEFAVGGGFGYIKIEFDYAHDDTFDKELKICRVADPLAIYGDPHSRAADSSDWNTAFELFPMTPAEFERQYKGADKVSWENDAPVNRDDEEITIAAQWVRDLYDRKLLKLSDGTVIAADVFLRKESGVSAADIAAAQGITVVGERSTRSYKVKRRLLSGAAVLENEDWPGRYIPIIPVYGDEINIEGKRHFQSLIWHAKDAQRAFNFQRSASTEAVGLEPKAPWIVPKGSVDEDENWATANTISHAYLEYDPGKGPPPQRTQLNLSAGAAAMQEAMAANDDMKAIMGIYDASLGQRSNETSGKAIMARQREGDISTFHFIDNLSRAIKHTGRVLIDLIPSVYSGERVIRVLGEDGEADNAQLGREPVRGPQAPPGQPEPQVKNIYNLGIGKYDLAVEAGPSFTTRRAEAAEQMTEFVRAFPEAAPLIGDILVKSLDWQNADEIADRIKAAREGAAQNNPEAQKLQMEQQKLELQAKNDERKAALNIEVERQKMEIERQKAAMEIEIEQMKAQAQIEIERMKAGAQMQMAQQKSESDIAMKQHEAKAIKPQPAVGLNVPESVAQAIAETVAPAMAAAMQEAAKQMVGTLGNMKLSVAMPRMKRTAVRDRAGNITHAIDEPIEETLQ
jgi:hypothetical protein